MKKLIAISTIALSSILVSTFVSAVECCQWNKDQTKCLRGCPRLTIDLNGLENSVQTPTCDIANLGLSTQK